MQQIRKTATINSKTKTTYGLILIPIGIAINIIGGMIAKQLGLPIFMDSIGTIIVAAIMGPLIGGSTGLLTNIVFGLIRGDVLSMAFGLANMSTGLIVGFMAKYGKFKNWIHLSIAAVFITIANSLIAAPIVVILYGGVSGAGVDLLVAGVLAAGKNILSSAFLARLPVNLVDKGIAITVAFLILTKLPDNMKNLIPKSKKKADIAS
ncbi:ECF transporter S component [Neobacillus notoginsengisoli]|uniref:ECF transporter S component n=1 Tax=Neobacillus notoginsengisoli TaxID=1578198 RepID=A0A417YII5_9BACI|nr:ECF transporter S component [Neobacillus notoginsengisoli]RHW32823.1 ECF transporter S component [Neobacillus notoginsengisoli]